jgi:hypothetical protein
VIFRFVTVRPTDTIVARPQGEFNLRGPFPGRVRVGQEPDVGQQLSQPVGRSGGEQPKNVGQVAERIKATSLATGRHAEQHRRR